MPKTSVTTEPPSGEKPDTPQPPEATTHTPEGGLVLKSSIFFPLLTALSLLCALLGQPGLWLTLASLTFAGLLSIRDTALAKLAAAFVVIISLVTATSMLAGFASYPLLRKAPLLLALEILISLLPVLVVIWRKELGSKITLFSWPELIAALPVLVPLVVVVRLATLPAKAAASWYYISHDSVTHVLMVGQLRFQGYLSYGAPTVPTQSFTAYPRAVHTMLASMSGVLFGNGTSSPEELAYTLKATAVMSWALYGLAMLVAALAARKLTLRLGGSRGLSVLAGFLASAFLLTTGFLPYSMVEGYMGSMALNLVLLVVVYEVVRGLDGSVSQNFLIATSLLFVANSYQVAVLPVVFVFFVSLWLLYKRVKQQGMTLPRVTVLTYTLLCGLLSIPAMWAIASGSGTSSFAATAATDLILPWVWLIGCLLSALFIFVMRRKNTPALNVAIMFLLLVLTALGGALVGHARINDYYPSKLLWHSVILAFPLLFAVAFGAIPWNSLRQRLREVPIVRVVAPVFLGLVVVVTLTAGLTQYTPDLIKDSVSGDVSGLVAISTDPKAPQAEYVWSSLIGKPTIAKTPGTADKYTMSLIAYQTDLLTAMTLSFYHPELGLPINLVRPFPVAYSPIVSCTYLKEHNVTQAISLLPRSTLVPYCPIVKFTWNQVPTP